MTGKRGLAKNQVLLYNECYIYFRCFLKWLIKPLVEASWLVTGSLDSNSLTMTLANCLPSSTLRKGKEKESLKDLKN